MRNALLVLSVLLFTGCAGYKLGPSNGMEAGARSVQINPPVNQTFEPRLAEALNHHIGEEEQTILNPARTEVSEDVREDLGVKWATMRNRLIEEGCGSVENVRAIVKKAEKEGLLPADDEDGDSKS